MKLKRITGVERGAAALALAVVLTAAYVPAAGALATGPSADKESARVAVIINAGDREINRRLKTLGNAKTRIASAKHVSDGSKASLSSEVDTETNGLTALKTKLDSETTLDGAKTDAQSIITDYRVYALIVPKLQLVKVADDQQVVEGKLSALAQKLQTKLSAEQGKDVSNLQAKLTDMNAQIKAASAISGSIEGKLLDLQPTDYNSDHTVLSGYRDQLQTSRADNAAAYTDAQAIVVGLAKL